MTTLVVLVPRPHTNAAAAIDRGSGIVANAHAAEWAAEAFFDVYYEGNRYGAVNLTRFEDKVECAAGRLSTRYPTIARGTFPREEFRVVGYFSYDAAEGEHQLRIVDEATLRAWTGGDDDV